MAELHRGTNRTQVLGDGQGVVQTDRSGADNDTVYGDAGSDTVLGDDLFVFDSGQGADVINGFTVGAGTDDVINLNGFGSAFDEFAEILASASDDGTNTTIDFGGGNSITLNGVLVAELHQDDFLFTDF